MVNVQTHNGKILNKHSVKFHSIETHKINVLYSIVKQHFNMDVLNVKMDMI
jgi:hypothetical protein